MLGRDLSASATDADREFIFGYNATGKADQTFYVTADQGVYHAGNTTTWSTTSDVRIKKNISDNNEGLALINKITVRNFEYKTADEIESDGEVTVSAAIDKTGTQIGVIAQELQSVRESWVEQSSTGVLKVETNDIIWHLVNSVKELSAQNDALAAEVASLKSQINN